LLTYKIHKPKASAKGKKPPHLPRRTHADIDQETILRINLEKTLFQVGDRVRFKKPRRPVVVGTVVDIQTEVSEITWANDDSLPMNIVLEVDKGNGKSERVKTNVKKLTFYGVLA
jgi:hypothetical protein